MLVSLLVKKHHVINITARVTPSPTLDKVGIPGTGDGIQSRVVSL